MAKKRATFNLTGRNVWIDGVQHHADRRVIEGTLTHPDWTTETIRGVTVQDPTAPDETITCTQDVE